MHHLLGLVLIMGTYSSIYAKSYSKNCFREHISESIAINKERKKDYARMTDGESDKIFTHLIAMEHLTLPVAFYYDLKARPFQKKGMDLFCHEFMSMNKVSTFDETKRIIPDYAFPVLSFAQYKKDLRDAVRNDDLALVKKLSLEQLDILRPYPQFHCMTRHMIESIYRFAYFVNIREKEAQELKVESPRTLMMKVISSHLLGMDDSIKIDRWSRSIQEKGVPILCSELPDLTFDLKEQ